jgi:tRNA A-37 threonylcarbamoyl transferase component Bud32
MSATASSEVGGTTWIKAEPWTQVWVAGDLCHKAYAVPLLLRWRTWLRVSRARREFENLSELAAAGFAVTSPVAWCEDRRLGFVRTSTLSTRWLPDMVSLKAWLAAPSGDRAALARALGRRLAALHRAGFASNTGSPRNWLLSRRAWGEHAGESALVLCDQNHLTSFGRSLHGGRIAGVDLYSLVLGPSRARDMTRAFRFRLLLAYCDGDRAQARRLWGKIGGWSPLRFRLQRYLNILAGMLAGLGRRDGH